MPSVSPGLGSAPIQRECCIFLVDVYWVLGFYYFFVLRIIWCLWFHCGMWCELFGPPGGGGGTQRVGLARQSDVDRIDYPFMVSYCKTALNQRVIFTMFSPAWCVQHTILEFNNCMLSWGGAELKVAAVI